MIYDPYSMPMGVHLPPMEAHFQPPMYAPPVDMGMPQQILPMQYGEVPHPEVVAEEQRKNLAQASQNLELKIKELTEANEQHKKSIADQADKQVQEYVARLQEQVQQTHSQVDAQLKANIEGHIRTVEEYKRRLQAQAQQSLVRYREKLAAEATEKAQQEFKVAEAHARAELEEQLKAARQFAQKGATADSEEWSRRAQVRYNEQVQRLQQTAQASMEQAREQPLLPASSGEPLAPVAPQAQVPEAPETQPVDPNPDDTN